MNLKPVVTPPSDPPEPAGAPPSAVPPTQPPTVTSEPTPTPPDARIKLWEDEGAAAYHNGLSIDANPYTSQVRDDETVTPAHPMRAWARGYVVTRKKAEPAWTGAEPDETASVDPQVEAALAKPDGMSAATLNTLYNRTLRQYRASLERTERLKRTLTRLEIVTRNKTHESEVSRETTLADGTAVRIVD